MAGDWVKGRLAARTIPPRVKDGVLRHRWVDSTTGLHPAVRDAHILFSPRRRRAVPIILDMVFDHLLIHSWPAYSAQPLQLFVDDCYAALHRTSPLWPEPARQVLPRLIEEDWLNSYADLDRLSFALARIEQRMSRDIGLGDADHEIRRALPELRSIHAALMRDLLDSLNTTAGGRAGLAPGSRC